MAKVAVRSKAVVSVVVDSLFTVALIMMGYCHSGKSATI